MIYIEDTTFSIDHGIGKSSRHIRVPSLLDVLWDEGQLNISELYLSIKPNMDNNKWVVVAGIGGSDDGAVQGARRSRLSTRSKEGTIGIPEGVVRPQWSTTTDGHKQQGGILQG